MKTLINTIQQAYPHITFAPADRFYWQPEMQTVHYAPDDTSDQAHWSLFHELAHALLGHKTYRTDLELLLLEAEAWTYAKALLQAHHPSSPIAEDHIQDCLDTYRDWLHARSMCPSCDQVGLQQTKYAYHCINCRQAWRVSMQRFKRPYRLCTPPIEKTPLVASKTQQAEFY